MVLIETFILWCKLIYLVVQVVVKPTLTLPKEFSFATGRPAMKPPTGVSIHMLLYFDFACAGTLVELI